LRTAFALLLLTPLVMGVAPVLPPGAPSLHPGEAPPARTRAPRRDLLERMKLSPEIIRGHVRSGRQVGKDDSTLPVHVDKWLKGTGPDEIVVDFGVLRPVTPEGQAELLFLVPALAPDGGVSAAGEARCLQENSERWEFADGAAQAIDDALAAQLSGAPPAKVFGLLTATGPRIAQEAAAQLSLLTARGPDAVAAAEEAVKSPATQPVAKADLIKLLPSRLSVEALLGAAAAGQPAQVRLAATEALAHGAVNEPSRRERVLPALLAASKQTAEPEIQFVAVYGLSELGRPEALAPIQGMLAGKDARLRADAIRALYELARAYAPARDELARYQTDSDAEVAQRAKTLSAKLPALPKPAVPSWAIGLGLLAAAGLVLGLRARRGR
jgi:hypothetical protein